LAYVVVFIAVVVAVVVVVIVRLPSTRRPRHTRNQEISPTPPTKKKRRETKTHK